MQDSKIIEVFIAPVIGGISGSIASLIVSFLLMKYFNNKDKFDKLNKTLNELNHITLQYPELESKKFIKKMKNPKFLDSTEFLRYDAYCCLWFNFLVELVEFLKYNKFKVDNYINLGDILATHKSWWMLEENINIYDKKFRKFMEGYLK